MLWTSAWCTFAGLGALYHAPRVQLPDYSSRSLARQFGQGEAPAEGRLSSLNELCYATDLPLAGNDHNALADWQLDKHPGVNSTGHLIFETVNSLLQHWPNTRMRNGHNIVPGTIPPGTLLYHGTWSSNLPPGPGWTATDPEHSMLFCRKLVKEDACWHLTLMSMRTLKVVYFDGSSAAKAPFATMDTQDIIAWGVVQPGWSLEERNKIEGLCKWGRQYSLDGFVRMEMDFEVMLCNFTSGVRLVSSLNLAGPVMPNRLNPRSSRMFEAMYAGSWHNNYPGETRIQLDLSGLVSFYDTELVPSLVSARSGKERWDHRLLNISREDVARVRARLGEVLTRPTGHTSGIDWRAMIRVVVDRYSERLEFVRYLLNSADTDGNDWNSVTDYAIKTQVQLRNMLVPYILVNTTPSPINQKIKETGSGVLNWARPTYRLCATTHTGLLKDEVMTSSEKVLLSAVRETTREICRVVTKMWGSGILVGVDQFMGTVNELDVEAIQNLMKTWRKDIDGLMAWLDWNAWVKCRPACGPEEICYLTTWPVGFPMPPLPPLPHKVGYVLPLPSQLTQCRISAPVGPPHIELADDWERPQPRCVRRADPYDKSFGDHP